MNVYKALSLWQPWASLMAWGLKRNETRSWYTSHRGPLVIHAAQKWDKEIDRTCWSRTFWPSLRPMVRGTGVRMFRDGLPRGKVVAVVNLIDCVEITRDNAPGGRERSFGDYTPGRFMWRTELIERIAVPFAWKGHQGLFEIDARLFRLPPCPARQTTSDSATKSRRESAERWPLFAAAPGPE